MDVVTRLAGSPSVDFMMLATCLARTDPPMIPPLDWVAARGRKVPRTRGKVWVGMGGATHAVHRIDHVRMDRASDLVRDSVAVPEYLT